MGLLDGGLQAVFGIAFGNIILPANIYQATRTQGQGGKFTTAFGAALPVKASYTEITRAMRDEPGYSETDVAIIVLQYQSGISVLKADDEIVMEPATANVRYRIRNPIAVDPARATWLFRASIKAGG